MSTIDRIEEAYARQDLPEFGIGNTVDVHVLIREGDPDTETLNYLLYL